MRGVCPDINLIDVRVFREDGLTDEFELLAAMQYLRWMNARAGTMQVHGANLSLSLIHEVRRFACGQTPICDECNDAAAVGIVVVTAAGNRGFDQVDMEEVRASDSYKTVSITDPGNAANVSQSGDIWIFRTTLSGYYEYPIVPSIAPFAGLGFGFSSLEIDNFLIDSGLAGTFHFEVGLSYQLADNIALVPAYRYEWNNVEFDGGDDSLTATSLRLGTRFSF